MNKNRWQRVRQLWQAEAFTPKDFARRAVVIGLAYAVAHGCGLRQFTSLLSGTTGSAELSWAVSSVFGVTYVLLYLAFVLLAPTLLLAAGLLAAWRRILACTDAHSATGAPTAPTDNRTL
jgi:hypothetical protein